MLYIVVYTPAGSGDLCTDKFEHHDQALAFVTGDGHSGLDYACEDDKAVIIHPDGTVEDHT